MPLTKRWTPIKEKGIIKLTGERLALSVANEFDANGFPAVRNAVVDCGRQSLKTELHKRMLVKGLGYSEHFTREYDDYRLFAAGPTEFQAKRIWWNDIKKLTPNSWWKYGGSISESELRITTNWGAELWIVGLDKPERVEGNSWDGGVIDESSNNKRGVWSLHIQPLLIARKGWSRHIGTPDFAGQGAEDYKGLSDRARQLNNDQWKRFHWPSWDVIPDEELQQLRDEKNALSFNQEFGGLWVIAPGRAYWEYNEDWHVTERARFKDGLPIFVCCDFNSANHNWLLLQIEIPIMLRTSEGKFVENTYSLPVFNFIDQVYLENASTPTMIKECKDRISMLNPSYLERLGFVRWYGDYSGNQKRSEADDSNWQAIAESFPASEGCFYYQPQGPINARIMKFNDALHSASDLIRVYVNPKCVELKKDLEFVKRAELFMQKGGERTHSSDAGGYAIVQFDASHLQAMDYSRADISKIGRALM